MRKYLCALGALLFAAALLTGCEGDVSEMSTLSELSRPYVGEYRCDTLTLAGEDMLSAFEYVRLELAYDGEATLSWQSAEGGRGEYTLRYEADPEAGRITFHVPGQAGAGRTFPMEKGSVRLWQNLGGRCLYARFGR